VLLRFWHETFSDGGNNHNGNGNGHGGANPRSMPRNISQTIGSG